MTKRLWEYDPLVFATHTYWIESQILPRFPCTICYETFPMRKLWSDCPTAKELFCYDCLKEYSKAKIQEGQVHSDRSVSCPCSSVNCVGRVKEVTVTALILEDFSLIEKFHQFSLAAEVSADQRKAFCPNRQCGSVVTRSGWTNRVSCQQCRISFCFSCRESHSPWISCSLVRHLLPLSSSSSHPSVWRSSIPKVAQRDPAGLQEVSEVSYLHREERGLHAHDLRTVSQ
jgi:hypothetical protein